MSNMDKTFLEEFIEIYKNEPALWQVKSDIYKSKTQKDKAWNKLFKKYKEIDKCATIDVVKKKVKCLRSSYRRELAKVRKSEGSGASVEEIYVPALWYFENLNFLKDQVFQPDCFNTFDESLDIERGIEPKLKKKKNSNATDELVRLATERLRNPQDPSHQIGIVWASKLIKMDRNQRIIAERIINEVMFNGELGLLNFNTTLNNLSSTSDLDPSSSSFNKSDSSESLLESTPVNNHTIKYDPSATPTEIIRQRFSTDRLNYSSPSPPLVNIESITDHENIQATQNFVVAEYNLLDNSIKMEE